MRTILLPLSLALAACSWASAADGADDRADKLIASAVGVWSVPGAAVAIVRGDDTLLLKGYGRRTLGKPDPVTPDTIFPLASCSKAFTTTLLAMLVDDGRLEWDDPLHKHFNGFSLSDPHADALLSVRDLLCHRCGLGGHDLLWYRAPWDIDEVLARASRLPLDYPFRSGYRYTTIPFLAAGRMAERIAGEKWETLVRARICEPLGMNNVAFTSVEAGRAADRAEGYRLGKTGKVEPMPAYIMRDPNPAGSVHATARDMAAWLKFHLGEGRTAEGARLVTAKALRETHTPQNLIRMDGLVRRLNPDSVQLSYAMGWLVYDYRGKKVLSHGGLIDGFRIQITFLPDERLGFAVLSNLHDTRFNAALTNSLIDVYCELPPRDWTTFFQKVASEEKSEKDHASQALTRTRDPDLKPALPLAAYAGEYVHPAYGTAIVAGKEQKITMSWSGFECGLEPFRGDTFQAVGGYFDEQLIPFTLKDGKVVGIRLAGQEFKRP